jgi:hypothetical protein
VTSNWGVWRRHFPVSSVGRHESLGFRWEENEKNIIVPRPKR